jgi:hypothetical protein
MISVAGWVKPVRDDAIKQIKQNGVQMLTTSVM